MARTIDCSFDGGAVEVSTSFLGKLQIDIEHGWKRHRYSSSEIVTVHAIDTDKYRSLGKSAATAVLGGVLTGGIGLIAGAIIGGRRRTTASYLVTFTDGQYAAFEVSKHAQVALLDAILDRQKVHALRGTKPPDQNT